MIIHLIEVDKTPEIGSVVKSNCDEIIIFESPISVNYADEGRMCESCLDIHRYSKIVRKMTFAHQKE